MEERLVSKAKLARGQHSRLHYLCFPILRQKETRRNPADQGCKTGPLRSSKSGIKS